MQADKFLESIADYYMSGQPGVHPLSTITFVLPNKRSAMFLKQYIKERCQGVTLLPRLMTMRTFINIFAPHPEAPARELLFLLYNAYRSVMAQKGRSDTVREFDSFIFWGDMILNDFNDIDTALANAEEVFHNLSALKEIQADYLDSDQKAIISRIWGDTRLTANVDKFWLHLSEGSPNGVGQKFVYLWEALADIYHEFTAALEVSGFSTIGGQYRAVAKASRDIDMFDLSGDTHYAFVGFNDLSNAETVILDRLKAAGHADFFWDTAPIELFAGSTMLPKPLKRLSELTKHFPMPYGYDVPLPTQKPAISVDAVPSRVAQAKSAGDILEAWLNEGALVGSDAINTAVVLPDQGLVIPTLLAVPATITKLNISLGLPYRTTSFATLFHAIISMQLRAKKMHGEYHYFFEDVTAVLSHPHIRAIAADAADELSTLIAEKKLFYVPESIFADKHALLQSVFKAVASSHDVADTTVYLTTLLNTLGESLQSLTDTPGRPDFELEAIRYFRDEVENIAALAEKYKIEMNERTFLHLFERIFNSRALTLSGEPLAGLQLLGVLETRALDFENVIMMSVNEGTFPRRQYGKTMIPGILRTGYGLPDFDKLEWDYAYCFYRLVARARRVVLIYDSRTGGSDTGEVSRYVSQLLYAVPAVTPTCQTLSLPSKPGENLTISVAKTPEVMKHVNRLLAGGDRYLSATALKAYKICPLSFYLQYVRNMRPSDELVDYVTDAQYGSIVHNTIQGLYNNYLGKRITPDILQSWLANDCSLIKDEALRQLFAVRYKFLSDEPSTDRLTPEETLVWEVVTTAVQANIEAELKRYFTPDFIFDEAEKEIKTNDAEHRYGPWRINDSLAVNFKMSIDRVDRVGPGRLRFIDFKTGGEESFVKDVVGLVARKKTKKDGMFQVFTYCEAYLSMVDDTVEIEPVIHPLRDICAGLGIPTMRVNQVPINSYNEKRQDFVPHLHRLIEEIFDPAVPFSQTEDSGSCGYCPFIALCGRMVTT